jgi:two-component system response regulator YesN
MQWGDHSGGAGTDVAPGKDGGALEDIVLEKPAAEKRILAAIEFLNEKLYDPGLAPSCVARHVGLEAWQFCRRFKMVTGMTCNEFIAEKRMQEARKLLARQDLLIKEIAFRVGFADANYFSRRFRRVVGTSPTSYRRANPARESGN